MKDIVVCVTSVLLMKTMAVVHSRGGGKRYIVYVISSASPRAFTHYRLAININKIYKNLSTSYLFTKTYYNLEYFYLYACRILIICFIPVGFHTFDALPASLSHDTCTESDITVTYATFIQSNFVASPQRDKTKTTKCFQVKTNVTSKTSDLS